jgi:putative transposase
MDNHVHLLLTPPVLGATAQLMQKLGRQYVSQFNARHGRTGTLWEGRFKSCLVDSESYVLRCYRYIDLNHLRARIVADASQFRWSSASAHSGHRHDALLTEHPAYLGLGATPGERGTAYRALLSETVSDDEMLAIRLYLQQQRALGRDAFKAMVEAKTQRFAGIRPAHRPRRK